MHRLWRAGALLNLALVALLAIAAPAQAASWKPVRTLNGPHRAFGIPGALARSSDNVTGAVYAEQLPSLAFRIWFRRSTDGGDTWQPAVALSADSVQAADPSLATGGSGFHAVWTEIVSGKVVVRYARSVDGGVSWGGKKTLSPTGESAYTPRVAGDANGRVVVVWAASPGNLYARISADGGATFGSRQTVAAVSCGCWETFPAVGIGKNGKLHVVYNNGGVWYSRSGDGGASWSAPVQLAAETDEVYAPAIAASGLTVLVGYTRRSSDGDAWVQVRRSLNNGGAWEPAQSLSSKAAKDSYQLVLSARSGTWRAAFARCSNLLCDASETFVRQSTDKGTTWSSTRQASPAGGEDLAHPIGVDGGGKTVVVWMGISNDGGVSVVHSRRDL